MGLRVTMVLHTKFCPPYFCKIPEMRVLRVREIELTGIETPIHIYTYKIDRVKIKKM